MGRQIRKKIRKKGLDQQGQATTEYILILSVATIMAVIVIKSFLGPTYEKIVNLVTNKIEQRVFGADMHFYRVRR